MQYTIIINKIDNDVTIPCVVSPLHKTSTESNRDEITHLQEPVTESSGKIFVKPQKTKKVNLLQAMAEGHGLEQRSRSQAMSTHLSRYY